MGLTPPFHWIIKSLDHLSLDHWITKSLDHKVTGSPNHWITGSRLLKCSSVPVFKCSSVQVFKCSSVQVFQCSSDPVFQCSSDQEIAFTSPLLSKSTLLAASILSPFRSIITFTIVWRFLNTSSTTLIPERMF